VGQSGYVLGAGEAYEITGWRKSDAEIAAFNFTSAGRSYAERTGRPANIGVIGVALFLERPAQISQYVPLDQKSEESSRGRSEDAASAAPQSPVASPSPKSAGAQSLSNVAPAEKLGTGMERARHRTFRTRSLTACRVRRTRSSRFATTASRTWWRWERTLAAGLAARSESVSRFKLTEDVPDPPGADNGVNE